MTTTKSKAKARKSKATRKAPPTLPTNKQFAEFLRGGILHDRDRIVERELKRLDPSGVMSHRDLLLKYAEAMRGLTGRQYSHALADHVAASGIYEYLTRLRAERPKVYDRITEWSDRLLARLIEFMPILGVAGPTHVLQVMARYERTILAVIEGDAIPKDPAKPAALKPIAAPEPEEAEEEAEEEPEQEAPPTPRPTPRPADLSGFKMRPKPAEPPKKRGPKPKVRTELETGRVTLIDARVAQALRVALEATMREIGDRYSLDVRCVKGAFHPDLANYRIVVTTKGEPRVVVHDPTQPAAPTDPMPRHGRYPVRIEATPDERGLAWCWAEAHDAKARAQATCKLPPAVPGDALRVYRGEPNLIDVRSIRFLPRSSRPYDVDIVYRTRGPHPYDGRMWLPLACIKDMLPWSTSKKLAHETDHPKLALAGRFEAFTQTAPDKVYEIFMRHVAAPITE